MSRGYDDLLAPTPAWQRWIQVVVLPLSIVALGLGFRHHHNGRIVAAGVLGMALLTAGATVAHDNWGLAADRAFTIAGALILAAAHFYNSVQTRDRRNSASC